jgi:microcin C transport system permease protein
LAGGVKVGLIGRADAARGCDLLTRATAESSMGAYFLRRLLLVPLTFVGITLLVFTVTRLAPGGPMDALRAQRQATETKRGGREEMSSQASWQQALADQERFDFHKSIPVAYLRWFGIVPREVRVAREEIPDGESLVRVPLSGSGRPVEVQVEGGRVVAAKMADDGSPLGSEWRVRVETREELRQRWLAANSEVGFAAFLKRVRGDEPPGANGAAAAEKRGFFARVFGKPPPPREPPASIRARAMVYQEHRSGLLQGDLRSSFRYNEPVWELMRQRFPVSTFYGILTLLVTYTVCVPLGVLKAIRHRTFVDNASSALIFMGYAIPGYALGSVLLLVFGARLGWFPMSGFTSDNFDALSPLGKAADLFHHAVMPLMCYLIGSFAMLTMMVKNNLMDNLAADYVRTATAKGVAYPRAVVGHALRNSLIPVAATFGGNLGLFLMGSFVIEKIFDINGFGFLGFNAALERDYMVTMGILTVSALLMLLGNILSDLMVALVDPRVSYQ